MHFPNRFQTASSLIGLNSRISKLDNLLGFIPKGHVVFIKGTRSRKHLLELFCLRSIQQYQNYCIFIDGGNSFDPYLLAKLTKKENPKEILGRIMISRGFTCHQLTHLIIKETENMLKTFPTNLVAVSDILRIFTDPESDAERYEIEMILPNMLKALKDTAGKSIIVMVTADNSNDSLNRMIESYSDIVLEVDDYTDIVNVALIKHPSRKTTSIELILQDKPEITKPATIEPWLIVNG
jgi:hypothetical protein